MTLFRREAVVEQQNRLSGSVLITQPIPATLLIYFLALIMSAALIFVSVCSFARKETVRGYVVTDTVVTQLYAPRNGIVESVFVKEGQHLIAGQSLLNLVSSIYLPDGESAHKRLLDQLDTRIKELRMRITLEEKQYTQEKDRLKALIAGMREERRHLQNQYELQKQRFSLLTEQRKNISKILKQGAISNADWLAREEKYLSFNQEIEAVSQQIARFQKDLRDAEISLQALPDKHAARQSELRDLQQQYLRQQTDIEMQGSITLKAPQLGKVSTLQVKPGQSLAASDFLLSILPEGSHLEALLFIPSRAVGFIQKNQTVKLLYDAFPYQRFGVQFGTIEHISETAQLPQELNASFMLQEPAYKAKVKLDKQEIIAYGNPHSLQPGMLLTAEIILEKRSLLEWLLEPVLSVSRKM